jgi:hypothetical protein
MDQKTVRDQVTKLHAELRDAHGADPEGRRSLGELLPDISRLMQQPQGDASASDTTLPDRLERVAVQFEVDHPALAASARRLIDLLGKAGL